MKRARIQIIASMTIFGTLGLFVRRISVSSGELALYRAVLAALLIGLYLLVTKRGIRLPDIRRELPLLLVSGIAMGLNWVFLFEAYRYTTVSVATLSYYFAPILVTVVCPFLFRERMTGRQLLCSCMSTIGLILIIGVSGFGRSGTDLIGIAFGLGAAVFYAAVRLLHVFTVPVRNFDSESICPDDRRCAFGRPERERLDQSADCRPVPYRRYLLYVFLITPRAAWTGGGDSQLYGPPCGSDRIRCLSQ